MTTWLMILLQAELACATMGGLALYDFLMMHHEPPQQPAIVQTLLATGECVLAEPGTEMLVQFTEVPGIMLIVEESVEGSYAEIGYIHNDYLRRVEN